MSRYGHDMSSSSVKLGRLIPITLAGLIMIGPFTVDTPFPAFSAIQSDFHVGASATQQLVSFYLFTFGVMSVFHGPLSDAIGRKPVMIGGVAVYALASLGCVFAPNMTVLLVLRAVQGISAGGGVVLARTLVRDLYDGPDAQRLMSRVMMIFSLAPAIAPIIGGVIVANANWRWIFAGLALLGLVLIALIIFVLPETQPVERRTPLKVSALVANLWEVARNPTFLSIALIAALSFGALFAYIGAAAIVVVDLLHLGETDFWMLFVPLIGGMLVGSYVSGRAAGRIATTRLVTLSLTGAVVAAGLNLALSETILPLQMLGPALIAFAVQTGYPTVQLLLLDMFPQTRGAATSVMTVISLVLNAVVAGLLTPLVAHSMLSLAVTSLLAVLLAYGLWRRYLAQHPKALES